MFLQFVPKTHLFFTAGKDKKIKQWDADKFEHIQTLEVSFSPDNLTASETSKQSWKDERDAFSGKLLMEALTGPNLPLRVIIGRCGAWPSAPAGTTW